MIEPTFCGHIFRIVGREVISLLHSRIIGFMGRSQISEEYVNYN